MTHDLDHALLSAQTVLRGISRVTSTSPQRLLPANSFLEGAEARLGGT
jgi:hypothetical protein